MKSLVRILPMVAAMAVLPLQQTVARTAEVEIASEPLCVTSLSGWNAAMSGMAVTNTVIGSGGEFIYQAGFYPDTWGGSLRKWSLLPDGESAASFIWDAGDLLTGPAEARNIHTWAPGRALATVPFLWASLNNEQKAALNRVAGSGAADQLGEKRLPFLRGDRTEEGKLFRKRARLLGDIINGVPVYAGPPARAEGGADYLEFADTYAGRRPMVYVGANDGMLHAFDADDGKEVFAYIPNALLPHLPELSDPAYRHRPYVDGAIRVSETLIDGQWKTVLVASFGGGAQGVFALDVTDPSAFGKSRGALFEFTDADDPDMGNLLTAPVIARFRTSAGNFRYFAVVASGVNNHKDDGTRADGQPKFNADAAAVLFLLALDKPAAAAWRENHNYYKFRLPVTDPASQNGLSAPALVADGAGNVVRAYAGDLQGNLWRFDFSGEAPWPNALSPAPLFIAKDAHGRRQGISTQPRVVFAPGGYVVLFGTGKFIEKSDAESGSFALQSFYGIYDDGSDDHVVNGRDELASRHAEGNGENAYVVTGHPFIYGRGATGKKGWYLDLPEARTNGERIVSSAIVMAGRVFFHSLIPANGACTGRSYELDALTGLRVAGSPTGHVIPQDTMGPPVPVQVEVMTGSRRPTGDRVITRRIRLVEPGHAGSREKPEQPVPPAGKRRGTDVQVRAGRFSWREIHDWKERRNAGKE